MNKLFIAVGGLVIALLFAALIGPHLVDWTAYRDTFERQASAAIGRPVTIAGKANVRLLPTPVVSFTDMRIGGSKPDVEIERFRAEVELAPLLKGEVRVIHMTVERPRFLVDVASLVTGIANSQAQRWRVDPERISLSRMEIIDGTAIVEDGPNGRRWQADDLGAVIEAGSLRGPAKIDARAVFGDRAFSLKANFGRHEPGDGVTLGLTLTTPDVPAALTTDGVVTIADGMTPTYAGSISLIGDPILEDSTAPRTPWADFRTVGTFEATPEQLTLKQAQVSYGAMERPLVLESSGALSFGALPSFDLAVKARQIDLDRAMGGGAGRPVAIRAIVERLLALVPQIPQTPITGALHLRAQGVVVGGGIIQAVAADIATKADGWAIEQLTAVLPGETEVSVSGTLHRVQTMRFEGRGAIQSGRPAALAAWLRGGAGTAAALDRFAIEADMAIEPRSQKFTAIRATTGDGLTIGEVSLRRFEPSDQLFVTIGLNADRADLVQARALAELLIGPGIAAGAIDQMAFSLAADVLSARGIEAHSVVLDGGLENGELQLRRLSVADLAGASIEARGNLRDPFGARSGRLEASLQASDIGGAAEFLSGVLPDNPIVAHLRAAAPVLSPVRLDVSAETGGKDQPLSLDLTGTFATTNIAMDAAGTGSLADPASLDGRLNVHVDSERTATVLEQLGLDPLPVDAGPVRLDGHFLGHLAEAGELSLKGTVANVLVDYQARTTMTASGQIGIAGDLSAESDDIDPALLLGGFALPGLGEGHAAMAAGRLEGTLDELRFALHDATLDGAPLGGSLAVSFSDKVRVSGSLDVKAASLPGLFALATGTVPDGLAEGWSDRLFAATVPSDLAFDLTLTADQLDLGLPSPASEAALKLRLEGDALNVDLMRAEYAGGVVKGAIAVSLGAGEADLALRGAIEAGDLQALAWERGGLPIASGQIDAAFDISGRGRSMAGLVSSLDGSGSFAVRQGRINAMNAGALTSIMQAAGGETAPDEQAARETFAIQFGSGALAFDRAAGSFSVTDGVARVATVSLGAGPTNVLADAAIDINAFTLESNWSVRVADAESPRTAQPFVRLRFFGPVSDPERRVELEPLLELLQSRYLQRQLDRIEALEEERRQAEARRQSANAPAAPASPAVGAPALAGGGPVPQWNALAPARSGSAVGKAPAVPATRSAAKPTAPPGPVTSASDGIPLSLVPEETPTLDLMEQLAPAIQDVATGGSPDLTGPDAAEIAPADDEAARPPVPRLRGPFGRRASPRPRAASPPGAPGRSRKAGEQDAYRTLPNGVTIKLR